MSRIEYIHRIDKLSLDDRTAQSISDAVERVRIGHDTSVLCTSGRRDTYHFGLCSGLR